MKAKKAKKREKPKLSFEEDEEDVPSGSKRSRSPSTGRSFNIASGQEAEIQNQGQRNDSQKTQMSILHSYPTERGKKKNV